jgi:hypothetical protein
MSRAFCHREKGSAVMPDRKFQLIVIAVFTLIALPAAAKKHNRPSRAAIVADYFTSMGRHSRGPNGAIRQNATKGYLGLAKREREKITPHDQLRAIFGEGAFRLDGKRQTGQRVFWQTPTGASLLGELRDGKGGQIFIAGTAARRHRNRRIGEWLLHELKAQTRGRRPDIEEQLQDNSDNHRTVVFRRIYRDRHGRPLSGSVAGGKRATDHAIEGLPKVLRESLHADKRMTSASDYRAPTGDLAFAVVASALDSRDNRRRRNRVSVSWTSKKRADGKAVAKGEKVRHRMLIKGDNVIHEEEVFQHGKERLSQRRGRVSRWYKRQRSRKVMPREKLVADHFWGLAQYEGEGEDIVAKRQCGGYRGLAAWERKEVGTPNELMKVLFGFGELVFKRRQNKTSAYWQHADGRLQQLGYLDGPRKGRVFVLNAATRQLRNSWIGERALAELYSGATTSKGYGYDGNERMTRFPREVVQNESDESTVAVSQRKKYEERFDQREVPRERTWVIKENYGHILSSLRRVLPKQVRSSLNFGKTVHHGGSVKLAWTSKQVPYERDLRSGPAMLTVPKGYVVEHSLHLRKKGYEGQQVVHHYEIVAKDPLLRQPTKLGSVEAERMLIKRLKKSHAAAKKKDSESHTFKRSSLESTFDWGMETLTDAGEIALFVKHYCRQPATRNRYESTILFRLNSDRYPHQPGTEQTWRKAVEAVGFTSGNNAANRLRKAKRQAAARMVEAMEANRYLNGSWRDTAIATLNSKAQIETFVRGYMTLFPESAAYYLMVRGTQGTSGIRFAEGTGAIWRQAIERFANNSDAKVAGVVNIDPPASLRSPKGEAISSGDAIYRRVNRIAAEKSRGVFETAREILTSEQDIAAFARYLGRRPEYRYSPGTYMVESSTLGARIENAESWRRAAITIGHMSATETNRELHRQGKSRLAAWVTRFEAARDRRASPMPWYDRAIGRLNDRASITDFIDAYSSVFPKLAAYRIYYRGTYGPESNSGFPSIKFRPGTETIWLAVLKERGLVN